jgi:hypothetical protein
LRVAAAIELQDEALDIRINGLIGPRHQVRAGFSKIFFSLLKVRWH